MPDNQVEDVVGVDSAGFDAAVVAEQVRLLIHKRVDLPINLLNASIVTATLWPLYPTLLLVPWLGLFCILILARLLTRRRYQIAVPSVEMAPRWGRLFTLNAFATACLWGLTGSVILVTSDPLYHLFIVFVLGGMMAGGIVGNSAYMPTMIAFMLPTILPVIVVLISSRHIIQIEMGVMLVAFTAVVIIAGRNINRSIIDNFRLRISQDFLLIKLRTSEAAMANSQAIAHVGSWEFDERTKVSAWSTETYRIFGVDPTTFKPTYEAAMARVHPLDRAAIKDGLATLIAGGTDYTVNHRIVMDDATIKYVHAITQVNRDAVGNVLTLRGTVQDITERRKGEDAGTLLAALVDSSIDPIVGETVAGAVTIWNPAAERLYGYRADEIMGEDVGVIIPQERREEIKRTLGMAAKGLHIQPFDTERLTKDGTLVPVSIAVSLTRDTAGTVIGASYITRDIRERRRAAGALAEQDRLRRSVTVGTSLLVKAESLDHGMSEALRILGESMRVDRVLVMQECLEPMSSPTLRYSWQVKGLPKTVDLSTFAPSAQDATALCKWRAQMNDGAPLMAQLATSEGPVHAMLEHFGNQSTLLVPILFADRLWGNLAIDSSRTVREWTTTEIDILKIFGEIAGSLIVHDETLRSLTRSEERFRMLTTAAQDAIITIDEAGTISHWNRAAERILGYSAEEAFGKSAHKLLAPSSRVDEIDPVVAAGKTSLGRTLDLLVVRKDKKEIAVELSVSGAQVGGHWETIGILRDITERKVAESRLQFANILLKTEMEASPDGILVVDPNRKIISFNQRFVDIWKVPIADLVAKSDFAVLSTGMAAVKDSEEFLARVKHLYDHPEESGHDELEMDDGRFIDRYTVKLSSPANENLGRIWYFRDITERKLADAALAYRERLLHAVTIGTGILVKAESLDDGMPDALRILGDALLVDRVLVMQESSAELLSGAMPTLRHIWQVKDIQTLVDSSAFMLLPTERLAVSAWHAPLIANKPVATQAMTSEGPVRALLERFQIKSSLIVPIFVGDTLWGNLGIDSCKTVREWTPSETDTLKAFGEIAGSLAAQSEMQRLLERSEERFRAVTETAQDAIITIDVAARIGLWNRGAERMLGYSAEEALGKQVHDFLAPQRFRANARQGMENFVLNGEGASVGKTTQLAALKKDGTEIAVELSLAAARLGGNWEAIGILRDITERKIAGERLAFANLLLRTQMEASLDGVLIVDTDQAVIVYNKRFADIWKIPLADLVAGKDAAVLAKVASYAKDRESFVARVHYLYDHPGEDSREEFEVTDGRSIDRYTVTLYSPAREYLGRAWFFRDITERKRAEALALRMARYDVLTGLANRAVFVEALQYAIAAANRGEKSFAVLYLDLDHFKDVNDTLGHPVGDELLKSVADRLRANTRSTDTVARFGGDEFAIIVADIQDPTDAAMLADKLIKAFGIPFSVQGTEIHSSPSIGIATYGSEAPNAEVLLSNADVALYRAKSEGRGGYRFFTDAMDAEVQTRVALGAELRVAIDAGQLFLMYQPQVAIDSGRITGLEALVRWRHPTRGVLGPNLFIPIAEQIGLVSKLGHWVLWEACRQGKAWLDAGIAPGRICVNVSALQFRTPVALEADIAAALAQTGFPPRMLELELTESVLMDASRGHSILLQRLRQTGVTIAIDDFGTGYSSLDSLRRFPSNRIKIAQNFVTNLETTPGDAAIVRATIGLARELDLNVIAEGVETNEQCELLKKWGCGEVQGFRFARPLGVSEATSALQAGQIAPPPDNAKTGKA